MNVKLFSLKSHGNTRLSAHFKVKEWADPGHDDIKIDIDIVPLLEKLFSTLQCSKIIITSGFRHDSSGSFHTKGQAVDINCWHRINGKEIRYQGKEILLAAEDCGFMGIGWIPGTAASRAAVHLDTRPSPYRFDEMNGNRMVINNSWYSYFSAEKPTIKTYTVIKGDSLSKIGKKFGVPWQSIAKINNISAPYIIRPGQIIILP